MKFSPVNAKFPHLLHGGDYNPEQWFETPEVWDEDIRLMKLAGCNAMTVGIFSWSMLEPEEGRYEFGWLDAILDKLAENGLYAVLATPSGARPAWLSQKYPEVCRVDADRVRHLHGGRHNHCYTSPVYREKVRKINGLLAERYKDHPALLLWHVSNEYGGECHCPLCQAAFREFLKKKYGGDLEKLNHEWWLGFWSHRYTDWSQVESPSPIGENSVPGLNLDWKRFVTAQTIDFFRSETAPLRKFTPRVPVTTNLMGTYPGLDYREFAKALDVVSWDNYPAWHNGGQKTWELGADISFLHDLNRSLKHRPFLMMESTPSLVNWQRVNKLKRPGMHLLSSLQAVAHGSDSVQYFQWRKSRGGCEKFHGAVVDHCGHEHTRVFADVAGVGAALKKLDGVVGACVRPDAAILYDWQNRWAVDDAQALGREKKKYEETCKSHYRPFWKMGVPADIIGEDDDFLRYRLVAAPMLYMIRPGVAGRLETFVKQGGTLVVTYWSGLVNENDLCWLGGFPGPLRKAAGVWAEETDTLWDADQNSMEIAKDAPLGLKGSYRIFDVCDLIHPEGSRVLATYGRDFYKGRPALTVHPFGKGEVYYIAARTEERFLDDFYAGLVRKLRLKSALGTPLPEGVTAQLREGDAADYVFLMNFSEAEKAVRLPGAYLDLLSGEKQPAELTLPAYGVKVLKIPK